MHRQLALLRKRFPDTDRFGGLLFTERHPAPPEFAAAGFRHSRAPGELRAFYDDWDLVRHDRYVTWDQHPGIPIHCHPVDKVVARRPGGAPAPSSGSQSPRPTPSWLMRCSRRSTWAAHRGPGAPLRPTGRGGHGHHGRCAGGRRARARG